MEDIIINEFETSNGARKGRSLARRCAVAAATVAVAAASMVATATPSDALSSTSWGFQCNAQSHWVRESWPNIVTDSATYVPVYTATTLFQWTTAGWTAIRNSPWFTGMSNNSGRGVLGYVNGSPYFFVNGGSVAPQSGYVFSNLAPGSYRTVQSYFVNGRSWTSVGYEFVSGTRNTWCAA